MKEVEGFESIGSVLKRILEKKGFKFDDRERTEEDIVADNLIGFKRMCDIENAKEGNKHLFDGYNCSICKNKGAIYDVYQNGDKFEIVQIPCKCEKNRKTMRALKRSGLESVVHDFKFENYETKEPWQKTALETAKRYAENYKEHWLFMGGASGRGKTHLCTAAAIALLKKGDEVKYMLWRDEARRLKSMVNDPEYNSEIQYYKAVDILYIDDLFKTGRGVGKSAQMPTEADINLAFEIINSRAMRKKPTIISSESTLLDLMDIDEAIGGRIKQMCGEYFFNIGSKNTKNYRTE